MSGFRLRSTPAGPASGDLSGSYPDPLVTGLYGRPVSGEAPDADQVMIFDGTEWKPGTVRAAGSASGVTYFLNQGIAPQAPTTGLTATTVKQLGVGAEVGLHTATKNNVSTVGYDQVAGFVTDLNSPGVSSIPAGIWAFNVWASSTSSSVHFRVTVYTYNGSSLTQLGQSTDVALFSPAVTTQYTTSIVVSVTSVSSTDRLYVLLEATSSVAGQNVTFSFGDGTPSNVASTIPILQGTGIPHVIDGVVQNPAGPVDLATSDVSGTLPVSKGGTGLSASPTNGQLLIGNGTGYTRSTLTDGTGVTIANGAGSITLGINDSVVATVSGTTFTGVTKHNAGLSGSLTKLTDGTSYLIASGSTAITTGSNGAVTVFSPTSLPPSLGNVLLVDPVKGNDSTGAVSGGPFSTPEGAISYINAHSLTGVTVWIMPGTYNLSAGITIPATCALRGMSLQTVILQMLNVVSPTTLVTMGENTRIEDMQLKLTSSSVVDLVGMHFAGTSSVTAKLRTCVLTVDNHTVSSASSTNVYGVLSDGAGTLTNATFSFNCLKGSTINVLSNGGGLTCGIYQPSTGGGNQMSTRDMNVYVADPPDPTSTGIYAGIYTNNDNSQVQCRSTSLGAPDYRSVTTNTVRALSITNVSSLSGPQTHGGVSLIAGDRVLLTGQTTGTQNGIWVVAAGAWSRPVGEAYASTGANASGAWVYVSEGTYATQNWLCISYPATVGTDALTWKQTYQGVDIKVPVLARYTGGAPTGSRAAQGSYTPVTGDRIFLDSATSGIDNGTWIYNSAGAWIRSGDMPAGVNSRYTYITVSGGTYATTAWYCDTVGTVGTTSLTFTQRYLGSDILQGAPQAGNLTNGIQLGPGTDLITKSAGGRPFTTYVYPTTLLYSLKGNIQNGTYYMWPGVITTTDSAQVFYRLQQKSVLQGMTVNMRTSPGGVNTVTFTVLQSISGISGQGIATPMTLTLTDGQLQGSMFTTSVDLPQGSYIALQVVSNSGINNADVIVELDLF